MFGEWTGNLKHLHAEFQESGPVKYVLINNFFTEEWANKLYNDFPSPEDGSAPWKKFDDPVERRYTLWNFKGIPSDVSAVEAAHKPEFIKYIETITGFENILIDPCYEHATGLTAIPRNGKLGIHLDVNINKQSGTQRRCNLLIYLNKDWEDSYGGHLCVGDSPSTCRNILAPSWNTAIILENSSVSYHGVPIPLSCPEGVFRKNLAIYYSSLPLANADSRFRASWFPGPEHPVAPRLQRLYDIRSERAITPEDLSDWPSWKEDNT